MAALGSTLQSLTLFLCLGMLYISATSAEYNDSCILLSAVIPSTAPGIKANSDIYESNTVYTNENWGTVSVPVNSSTSSVVLRAVDTNRNSIGFWHKADQQCNSSALYHMKDSGERLFKANWESPRSVNITTVEIQALAVNFNKVATFSYLKLKKQAMTSTSPSMISTTRPAITQILRTTRILSTTRILNATTTKSLANRMFLSPMTDAVQILLVFLTSKLLF